MLLALHKILDADKIENITTLLSKATFVDGTFSAGETAALVKQNLEMQGNQQQTEYLDRLFMTSLAADENFRDAALPNHVSQPIFARYTQGMHYGLHIDDPIMGGSSGKFRCDIALTLFLNNADQYQGGELSIQTPFGAQDIKLNAGDAVLYPASSLHEVKPVTGGERLVAVCWIQSFVRDAQQREILYKLALARRATQHEPQQESQHQSQHQLQQALHQHIDHAYVNLVRMWSEI